MKKNKTKRTYVCMILDESGSMESCAKETISGYNEQLNMIQANAKDGGDTKVSLVTFGSRPNGLPHIQYWNGSPEKLMKLDESNYRPFGNTPMYDAIGLALTQLELEDQSGNVGFLIVVISDGQENASHEYSSADIARQVKRQQATGKYTFVYIGANQDLTKVKEQTGFGQNLQYAGTQVGTQSMYAVLNNSTADYFTQTRGFDSTTTNAFFENSKVAP